MGGRAVFGGFYIGGIRYLEIQLVGKIRYKYWQQMQFWENEIGKSDERCQSYPTISKQRYAQQLYQSLQKQQNQAEGTDQLYHIQKTCLEKTRICNCDKDKPKANQVNKKTICNEHALIIFQGLSSGSNIGQIRKNNHILQQYPMSMLRNMPMVTLLKLSKIFIQLLPKRYVSITPLQFYQKYLRTHEMLRFFKQHNVNLLATFKDLFDIKDWQRKNNEYLKRGYALDYLPSEIKEKLILLPSIYDDIVYIYDTFGYKLKTRQKRSKNEMISKPVEFTLAQEATQTGYEQGSKLIASTQQDQIFLSEKSLF